MAAKKIAISLPPEVLKQIDRAARERKKTLSAFITDLLRVAARARSDAQITRELDALFSEPKIRDEQRRTTLALAALRSSVGREW